MNGAIALIVCLAASILIVGLIVLDELNKSRRNKILAQKGLTTYNDETTEVAK